MIHAMHGFLDKMKYRAGCEREFHHKWWPAVWMMHNNLGVPYANQALLQQFVKKNRKMEDEVVCCRLLTTKNIFVFLIVCVINLVHMIDLNASVFFIPTIKFCHLISRKSQQGYENQSYSLNNNTKSLRYMSRWWESGLDAREIATIPVH